MKQGDLVRLTSKFLRNTGQYAGEEPHRVWAVQACSCRLCTSKRFVAVNQEDLDGVGQRHINTSNLEKVT